MNTKLQNKIKCVYYLKHHSQKEDYLATLPLLLMDGRTSASQPKISAVNAQTALDLLDTIGSNKIVPTLASKQLVEDQ